MTLKAYAKINLSLDITAKRDDGYHLLDTVMQSISLCDEVTIEKNSSGKINLSSNEKNIPLDKKNTAYKAAKLILDYGNITEFGVDIHIEKHIPSEAGMGGASADAAAVIRGMIKLFSLDIPVSKQIELATKVGADVPFCLIGGTKRCEGIGEIMSDAPILPNCNIVICKPQIGVSTPKAFSLWDSGNVQFFKTDNMINALKGGNIKDIACNLSNVFDELLDIEEVQNIKKTMIKSGALGAVMTGSGSAVYGIFDSVDNARVAAHNLQSFGKVFIAQPLNEVIS